MRKDEKFELAYELYKKRLSLSQVAKEFNVTRQCIYKAFKQRGFSMRSKNENHSQFYNNLKFTLRANGYYSHTTGKRILMHRYVYENEIGLIPEGFDIHHKDRNRANNHISNLECLSKSDHARIYSTGNNQFTKCK